MPYEHEIFISYKWGDDRKEWVDVVFEPILRKAVNAEMANRARIFKDTTNIKNGASLFASLKDALARSKCMVCVVTLPYFTDSVWCPTEFSAMLRREQELMIRDKADHMGLIFPIIFVDPAAPSFEKRSSIYKYKTYRELISNIMPLELDVYKYNFTNRAFLEGEDYNKLTSIITKWVKDSIIPVLETAPDCNETWANEHYFLEAYSTFSQTYHQEKINMGVPKM
jgi:hypothetical protein